MTRTFVILTTAPNAEVAELHDRMPVSSSRQAGRRASCGTVVRTVNDEIEGDYTARLRDTADGLLRAWPKNNGPGSLKAIAAIAGSHA